MRAEADNSKVFQRRLPGISSAIAAGFIGVLFAFMLLVTVAMLANGYLIFGAFFAAMTAFMFILFQYVLRDARGKLGWRVRIGADTLDLDLPPQRSLIHHLEPVHTKLRFEEIETIDTRLEAYRSCGMANMQRSYALILKTGARIVLGEDRALGTNLSSTYLEDIAEQIVTSGKLKLRDLGMAEGKGGALAVMFTAPPSWNAPNLDGKAQRALWKRASMTGLLASAMSLVVLFSAAMNLFS